jgi:outer membrane murein-binding lipoprotein Lpp
LQRRKTRTRQSELGAALVAALVLAGCGSGEQRRAAPQPKLPRAVATQLAARSDRVAAALDGGNGCGARVEAERLQRDTVKAINDRRVPGPFQEHLGAAVNDLVSRIQCTPPADDSETDKPGKRKGHKKDKKGDE